MTGLSTRVMRLRQSTASTAAASRPSTASSGSGSRGPATRPKVRSRGMSRRNLGSAFVSAASTTTASSQAGAGLAGVRR